MEIQIMGLFVEENEVPVPLRGVGVEIELSGMFAHTQIAQRYRNESDETIEAIYAFPLPTECVLLGMEIDISGKKLNGTVQSNNQARNTYEDAVTGGNGAFLLRQLSNGLYQMNVGNLKPGEEAEIRIRYGEILRWSGNTLRYRLPTVVAPHYGDPRSAGISREDVPETALLAEYPLTLGMTIKGDLARAEMSSPSHAVEIKRGESSTLVRLRKDASLDRDFILTFSMDAPSVWEVLTAPDGDRLVALGCLNVPTLGAPNKTEARDITIVVDCSGSMAGDSIAQVRSALLAILDELRDGNSVSILRFGSTVDVWTRRSVMLNKQNREKLRGKAISLEADLGGTEIMQAIRKAISISKPGADILLITDGEVYVDQGELNKIASTSNRFFTVGVGSAVSETIVKTLADVSGGACELVAPNEHMASRIVAHARRMSMPRAHLCIDWRTKELERVGTRNVVFAGDTLPVMAVLDGQPSGRPFATLETEERRFSYETQAKIAEGALAEALPRMVAWYRLNEEMSEEAAAELAVRYQLVTRHTSMVAVLERASDERTDGLPTLAEVPQMLAAGWEGSGTVLDVIRMSIVEHLSLSINPPDVDEVVDPVAEADIYLAYGRDVQANEILLDALKADPSRKEIHDKLQEIYDARNNMLELHVDYDDSIFLGAACPKCGGPVRKDDDKFKCTICDFALKKIIAGREFTRGEAEVLLADKVIGPLDGFRSKMGRQFTALIRLNAEHQPEFDFGQDSEDEADVVDFSGQEPLGKCPKCGSSVFEHGMTYVCEKAVGAAKSCDFRSGKIILQQPIERKQTTKLLKSGRTDLLRGFVSNRTRRKFSAYLVLSKDGKVGFEFAPRAAKASIRKAKDETAKAQDSAAKKSATAKMPTRMKTAKKS